ncbi:MAG TPA: PilT/PilU family type 4a pilus ATPase [Kofleriaceae bacterium]|nr:PilT/PilU family type 4a pilus ATPase [Kofleriaceae bacterium]
MGRLERLLEYLDQPDVAELVIGVDRPIAIRVGTAFRAVSQQSLAREHITDLLEDTPLTGLIDLDGSTFELEAFSRTLSVEVVREGSRVALRIAQKRVPSSTVADPRVSFRSTPATGVSSMPSARTPATGIPITNAGTTPRTPAPVTSSATRTPAASSPRTPATGVPVTGARTPPKGVPASGSPIDPTAPGPSTTNPPYGARTPATGVPLTTTPAGTGRAALPATAHGTTTPPMGTGAPRMMSPSEMPTTRIPFQQPGGDVPAELLISEPGEIEILLAPPDAWTGPRIVDERSNVAALVPLIRAARQASATDLHLAAGRSIMIRRVGELTALDPDKLAFGVSPGLRAALSGPLSPGTAQGLLWPLLGPSGQKQLATVGYVDLAVDVPGAGRVRVNVSRQQEGLCGTFRLITQTIPTLDSLGLPRELLKVIGHHQGLVVIAGPNGHGKTTTMAALVDQLNATKKHHIITIEEPVEVEHQPKLAMVSHREVLRHTLSFVAALKASLREDPDVIVIGELRDAETVEIALTAAETGHLVLATMSTPSAAKTIDRLIDMFPPDEQPQIRASISGTLRAVIAQRLLPTVDGTSVAAAVELVTGVLPLASLIRDNKLYQLPNLMQRGRAFGMIRLDDSLAELVRAKKITEAVALGATDNKKELAAMLAPRPTPGTSPPAQTQSKGLFGRKGKE